MLTVESRFHGSPSSGLGGLCVTGIRSALRLLFGKTGKIAIGNYRDDDFG